MSVPQPLTLKPCFFYLGSYCCPGGVVSAYPCGQAEGQEGPLGWTHLLRVSSARPAQAFKLGARWASFLLL